MTLKILGTGAHLPPKVVTNDDLAKTLDTSDEWIFSHSGIHSRHIATLEESTATMAADAGRKALEAAGVKPEEISLVIVATTSPDFHPLPATACIVQNALGCVNACAFDLMAACSGFVFALEQARGFLSLHPGTKALVIGSETLSRIVDWNDRGTCILFGDGAGAVVVGEAEPGVETKTWSFMRSDGSGSDVMYRNGGTHEKLWTEPRPDPTLVMNGRAVFAFAVKTMPLVVERLCADAGIAPSAIDLVVPHQANSRILESAAKRLELPLEKFFTNIETTGNTSGASVPLALDDAVRGGALKDGMLTCLVGFGGGLTYGGLLFTWPYL